MRVKVKLFAGAKDAAGASEVVVDVDEGASVSQLRAALKGAHPQLAHLERSLFAVNAEYAKESDVIPVDADIAFIPPVSGG